MASIAGVDTVLKNPVMTMEISLEGTMNVLRAANDCTGIKRVIDFLHERSVRLVCVSRSRGRRHEPRRGRRSPVDVRRQQACDRAPRPQLLEAVQPSRLSRFARSTSTGPGRWAKGAVHAFVVRALQGEKLLIHNEGDQIRSWCYIDDIVDAILLAMERDESLSGRASTSAIRAAPSRSTSSRS